VKQGEETSVPSVKVVSLAEAPPRERSFSPINRTRNSFGTGRDVDIVGGLPAPRASGNTLRVTMQLNISGEEKDVSFEFCVGEDNYDTVRTIWKVLPWFELAVLITLRLHEK
jgi:hypothetical protein